MTAGKGIRFLLIPLSNFNMLPFGAFLDKLRFSADFDDNSQQHRCSWQIMAHQAGLVCSSSGIPIMVEATPDEVELTRVDYVVLFGSRTAKESQQQANLYRSFLKKSMAMGVPIVSVDNACFTLAELGLLNGHQVVVHWRHHNEFRTDYPQVTVREEQLYHFDGKVISCTGGSATVDLAVAILQRYLGQAWAEKGLADMLVDETRANHHRLKSCQQGRHVNRHIERAITLMQENLAQGSSVDHIAALIGISRRQLDRLFQQAFGVSMHHHWQEMRMQHLQWRLNHSNHSLSHLADEVGIKDTSYLCKLFRKRFGISPTQYRQSISQGEQR